MVRVVIEGLDATGKTTVVAGLLDDLLLAGIPADSGNGLLARRHPGRWLFTAEALLRRHPHSNFVTGLFLVAYLLDRPLRRRPGVVIRDGYVACTVGYACAGGASRATRWAVRHAHWFARWDLAIHLTASHEVRCARLHRRARRRELSTADQLSLQDGFAEPFDKAVTAMLARGRHGQVVNVDTSVVRPADLVPMIAEVVKQMVAVDSPRGT
jgi:dTMP kinase